MTGALALVLVLALGGAAAATDWRERRVPNRLILLGLLAAASLAALQLAGSALGHAGRRALGLGEFYMPWSWYPAAATHAGLSLAASLALWRLDVWPAGDAKLFLTLSVLLPFVDPNLGGFPRLLFLAFLINVFVPAGLLFAAEGAGRAALAARAALARGPWVPVKAAADAARVRLRDACVSPWASAALVVNLVSLFFVLRFADERLHARPLGALGNVAAFLVMYGAWSRLAPVLRRPRAGLAALMLFFLAASAAAAGGADLAGMIARAAGSAVGFGFFLSLARAAFHGPLERAALERLAPGELRPGAILTEDAWLALRADPEASRLLEARRCDGLTAREAEGLRAWLTARGRGDVAVRRAVPFAAWILLGAALTVWRPGTVVSWLLRAAGRAGR